ncbi:MAG: hypothetical protein ACLTDR_05835 [Adlercreutzia equolifaciens]
MPWWTRAPARCSSVRHLGGAAAGAASDGGGPGQAPRRPTAWPRRPCRQAQATSLELSRGPGQPVRGRAEAARNTASAAAEKLASCRRELESVERQRAEAEAAVASARPNVESFEARVKELDAALDAGKKKQEAPARSWRPAPRGPSRFRQLRRGEAWRRPRSRAHQYHHPCRARPRRPRPLTPAGLPPPAVARRLLVHCARKIWSPPPACRAGARPHRR